jgi:DNA invertase Pin-like site-specific DNA recombinase
MREKLSASHLSRRAYVYVRQSTAAQVFEHGESTKRQYALVERAVALGWVREAVETVDEDLGRSATSTEGRNGFGRLVDAVVEGEAGGILAIEVSRLARSSEDWQRLLSLCAVAQVAVIDESTIYDPGTPDDKLLLELKGTMSEAELTWLGLRLTGARRSKARRGELRLAVPTGYVWGENGYELDPDEAVRGAVRLVFERFAVEPSAWAVVRWAREKGLLFPTRRGQGEGTSEVRWKPLGITRLIDMLHNPVYAGAYVFGRRRERKVLLEGQIRRVREASWDPARWPVRIEGAHEGYISWEAFVRNQEKLRQNVRSMGGVTAGAPREGPALLSGLVLCGRCGRRMQTTYRGSGRGSWRYGCPGDSDHGEPICWSLSGEPIDRAVEVCFLEAVVPSELELSLAVEREVERQAEDLGRQWRARIEQAQYEARRAERRYKAVDPENRVVARTLERQWEERLREVEEVERQYAEARRHRGVELTEADRARIRALARDLPSVWRAPTTSPEDRKAMVRLVIEAVSLYPVEVPRRATRVRIEWQSATVTELEVARADRRTRTQTPPEALERIGGLAGAGERDERIAERLNVEGFRTGAGKNWTRDAVRWARRRGKIERVAADAPRRPALPDRHPDGRYSVSGAAKRFGVTLEVVRGWLRRGLIFGRREAYGPHTRVWWLEIDAAAAARLEGGSRRTGAVGPSPARAETRQ